ncbi:lipoprotein [Pasteurellaceae bacterium LIM206]|nr:lipoprotein [Pasteurellaceae bacterium LIM206]
MKKLISVIFLTALCAALTACGVKGPLYFPDQQPENQQQPK